MTPKLESIDHVHIFVVDRPVSEAWYARVLGLHRAPEFEKWVSERGPLTLGNASGTVHIALFERPAETCRSVVALLATASEFLAWQSHLSASLGRPIEAVDHDLSWSLYFTDPDGNPFEITSYEHKHLTDAYARPSA